MPGLGPKKKGEYAMKEWYQMTDGECLEQMKTTSSGWSTTKAEHLLA